MKNAAPRNAAAPPVHARSFAPVNCSQLKRGRAMGDGSGLGATGIAGDEKVGIAGMGGGGVAMGGGDEVTGAGGDAIGSSGSDPNAGGTGVAAAGLAGGVWAVITGGAVSAGEVMLRGAPCCCMARSSIRTR